MGLSIHYKGKFNGKASLSQMIEEVRDICRVFNWHYNIYRQEFPDHDLSVPERQDIFGIEFMPPVCEPVSLCFLRNKRMSSPLNLQLWGNSGDPTKREMLYLISTKTQFAGIVVHKTIIHLFKHLVKSNYFEEFECIDEGDYYETGDEKLLETNFNKYDNLFNIFSLALESIPKQNRESFEKYFERLLKKISSRNKNEDQ